MQLVRKPLRTRSGGFLGDTGDRRDMQMLSVLGYQQRIRVLPYLSCCESRLHRSISQQAPGIDWPFSIRSQEEMGREH